MTIREQVLLVVGALADWAAANKGRAFVASDVVHLIEELRAVPGAPTAGVLWEKEDVRGELDLLGRVDRQFKVVISRGRGFNLISGESLTQGAAGGKPMFDLVEEAREVVLGLRLEDSAMDLQEQLPVYRGSGPFEVNELILDAVEIRFALAAQVTQQELPVEVAE